MLIKMYHIQLMHWPSQLSFVIFISNIAIETDLFPGLLTVIIDLFFTHVLFDVCYCVFLRARY